MGKNLLGHNFSLLHIDYVKLNKKWNYTNVISPYFRIYYIDEGEGFILSKQAKLYLMQLILQGISEPVLPSFLRRICRRHFTFRE
jgi:hypothetical protein